ncbi:MAG: hypothetical protein ACI4Q6_03115 [Huintestinicola sp.]
MKENFFRVIIISKLFSGDGYYGGGYFRQHYTQNADCDALTEKGGCTRLNVTVCIGEKCSFCTSASRLSSSEISSRRLSSLPEDEQKRISKKYYGGLMPWK